MHMNSFDFINKSLKLKAYSHKFNIFTYKITIVIPLDSKKTSTIVMFRLDRNNHKELNYHRHSYEFKADTCIPSKKALLLLKIY